MSRARLEPAAPTHSIQLPVRRTARVVLLGESSSSIEQVWIACHGYGQLAPAFAQELGALADPGRLVVVPEALNRYYLEDHGGVHGPDHPVGATWMTREERLVDIDDYCAYLDTVHDHVFASIERGNATLCVLGFSQGAATAARWVARTTRPVDHLVLWGAGLPPELDPGAFRKTPLTIVSGERDRYAADQVRAQSPALDAAGVEHTLESFDGGHRLDDVTLLRIAGQV